MRIGIDVGGTKISAIALSDCGGEVYRKRIPTPVQEGAEGIANAIARLAVDVKRYCGVTSASIGIGTPGALSSHTDLLKNSNTTCLNGQPLQQLLEAALQQPIRIANDANCFALSEAVDGAGQGADTVFGVIVGTGTGAGLVIKQHVLAGRNAIAGEWGHNPLPWANSGELASTECYCGKQGCIETFLSGPGLAESYWRSTGVCSTAPKIVELAELGDGAAEQVLQRYEDQMARALASVINVFDPTVIVLGGGLSKLQRLYVNVPKHWGRYVFSDHVATALLPAKHGDDSGVRGAAWLWND